MMDLTASIHKILCKCWKSVPETSPMIRQAFGEESMSHTWVSEMKRANSLETEKGDTGEEQSQEHLHNFL
jgi:hypothetical protein